MWGPLPQREEAEESSELSERTSVANCLMTSDPELLMSLLTFGDVY